MVVTWSQVSVLDFGMQTLNSSCDEADKIWDSKARFKRRATAVPNSIDRIKFDFSTAVARRLKPSRATAV